ncbi:MAG: heavy-metal-associated domain-containing protein [Brooklawnia sp.]|jgi:copper chaperone
MITKYTVTGMTCGHCVNAVTEEVGEIPGVTEVKVDQAGPMSVTSESAIDMAAIKAAVAEAGDYEVALA